jgi:hypothetical protein
VVPELVPEWRLGAFVLGDVVLLAGELLAKLGVGWLRLDFQVYVTLLS